MKTKQDLHSKTMDGVMAFCLASLLALAGCGGQEEPIIEKPDEPMVEKPDGIQLSDTEIILGVEGWKPLEESRAMLYDQESFLEDGNDSNPLPGGNFTINAYTSDGQTFLNGARAWYFADNTEWRFRSGNNLVTYYWPNSETDFYAYMPYKEYTAKEDYVTVSEDGKSFTCNLPSTNENDANQVEFIYAVARGMTKANNPLNFEFKHPFAAVYFKLSSESSRMTVNSIVLQNMYMQGTFLKEGKEEWEKKGSTSNYEATIGKRIPNDINYNTVFGGPFIVMPQPLSNQVKLILKATRSADETETETDNGKSTSIEASTMLTGEWLPGKKYIYTLVVGDKNQEIYFNVEVVDWIPVNYRNEINVE